MNMTDKIKKVFFLGLALARSQFKLRNEGSYLGIFWYLLDPFAMFFIILMLGGLLSVSMAENYPVYLFMGLIIFNFFRQATMQSINAITSNAGFIKSMRISSESFVVSFAIQSFFSHFFELLILLVFLIYFKISLLGMLAYFLAFIPLFLFSLGVSFFLAVLGVYVNDINNVWAVLMNMLWFSTPIFYAIPQNQATLLHKLNPMYYFVQMARELVMGGSVQLIKIAGIFVLSLAFFIAGILFFGAFKKKFAELL